MVYVLVKEVLKKNLVDLMRTSKSTLCLWNDGVNLNMMYFIDEEKLATLISAVVILRIMPANGILSKGVFGSVAYLLRIRFPLIVLSVFINYCN